MQIRQPQINFSSGEISSEFHSRVDHIRHATGLFTLRNRWVKRTGGEENRAGWTFVGRAGQNGVKNRLIPFEFSADQSYILAFGNAKMRVIHDGAFVVSDTGPIISISIATECVIGYSGADVLAYGDEVAISEVNGAMGKWVNNRNFKVSDVNTGAKTFKIRLMDGTTYVDSFSFDAYTSGGVFSIIYETALPWSAADIFDLQYVQNADLMLFTHGGYWTRKLTREDHDDWEEELAEFDWVPGTRRARGSITSTVRGAAGSAGNTHNYRYRLCAVASDDDELQPMFMRNGLSSDGYGITGITNADPPVVTVTNPIPPLSFVNGDEVFLYNVNGMVSSEGHTLNYKRFRIASVTATTFELEDFDTTAWSVYLSGGAVHREYGRVDSAQIPTFSAPNLINFSVMNGHQSINVYRAEDDGIYGRIGTIDAKNQNPDGSGSLTFSSMTFKDIGTPVDYSVLNPLSQYPFYNKNGEGYPAVCGFVGQRLAIAAMPLDVERINLSKTGSLTAFAKPIPLSDRSPITFKAWGKQVNQVRYVVDSDGTVIFTTGSEMLAQSGTSKVLTPTNIAAHAQSYNRSLGYRSPGQTGTTLQPLIADDVILYVDASGNIVRTLGFNYQVDGYDGEDVTIFSAHLLRGRRIVSWCYQKTPHSLIWLALDDGALISLTFIQKHAIAGWARHDTPGDVESVACIRENNKDVLYLSVKRTIDGEEVRYFERMADREAEDCFTDASIRFDFRNQNPAVTVRFSGSTSWDNGEYVVIDSNDSIFSAGDVGSFVLMEIPAVLGPNGGIITPAIQADIEIADYISPAMVLGNPTHLVPTALRDVQLSTWAIARTEISGGWHLEGESVSVYADGGVLANPNDPAEYDPLVFENGRITAPVPVVQGVVGLPVTADVQTLAASTALIAKGVLYNKLYVSLYRTRGGWFACEEPTTDLINRNIFSEFDSQSPANVGTGDPPDMITEVVQVDLQGAWAKVGRLFIRQSDPLPTSTLSIAPDGYGG